MTDQSENSTVSPAEPRSAQTAATHRRETRRQINLPFWGAVLLMVLVFSAIFIFVLPRRAQVSSVADFMVILMVLCPLFICQMIVLVALVAGIAGMSKAHRATEKPLRRLELMTEGLLQQIESTLDKVNQQTIRLSSKLASLQKLMGAFDRPQSDTNHEGKNEPESNSTGK